MLLATPYILDRFGLGGAGAAFAVYVFVWFWSSAASQAKRSSPGAKDDDQAEYGKSKARPRKVKGKDARGVSFYNLKPTQCTEEAAGPPAGQNAGKARRERTMTRDDNGDLWEFTTTLSHRTVSVPPMSTTGDAEPQLRPELEESLTALLSAAGLSGRLPEARRWCSEQGAAMVDEIVDNLTDFAVSLDLDKEALAALRRAAAAGGPSRAASRTVSFGLRTRTESMIKTLTAGLARAGSMLPGAGPSDFSLARQRTASASFGATRTTTAMGRTLTKTLSTTRTVSFLQHQPVRARSVTVNITEDVDDDDEDEKGSEDGEAVVPEPVSPKSPLNRSRHGKFLKAANAVLFGVRLKRKLGEFEALQATMEAVEPTAEERKLDARSALAQLAAFRAEPGCECLTLLIPAGTVTLKSLEKQADTKRARKYMQLFAAHLPGYGDDMPKNGLALFMKARGGQGENELVMIEPPRAVRKFALSDGPVFVTEILVQLFQPNAGAGCVVISGEEAAIYRIFADHAVQEAHISPHLQKRQKKGGMSALRIGRLAEEVRASYVRIVAERTNQEFVDDEGAATVEVLAIGGSKELADNLHASDHLHYRLKMIMKRAVDMKESDTPFQIHQKASTLRSQQADSSFTKLLREMEARSHTSLAAYGVKDVANRMQEGNIASLLFVSGCGLSSDLVSKVRSMKDVRVHEVPKASAAYDDLTKKWGGTFAMLRWEPQDYDN